MKFIFVGGLMPKDIYSSEIKAAKVPLQNAAENFQQAFISGLNQCHPSANSACIDVVTAPFFGSWPTAHKSPWIKSKSSTSSPYLKVHGIGYPNIPIIKNIFKYFNIKKTLLKCINSHSGDVIVFVYSLNLAYIAAVASLNKSGARVRIGAIVTDLPEHPADCSLLYKLYLKYIEKPLLSRYLHDFNFFVTLTSLIPSALKISQDKCVIVEGIYDEEYESHIDTSKVAPDRQNKVVLYTGTLDKRYGIVRLLDSFKSLADSAIELWVCGGGDGESLVVSAAEKNSKIKYLGSKQKKEIYELQRQADLLVNPRDNTGDYNKYSFPSKTMEYMASGTPTLIYQLDGIPAEYYLHLYTVDNESGESLETAITRVLATPKKVRINKGLGARNFILAHKTAKNQIHRVLNFLAAV